MEGKKQRGNLQINLTPEQYDQLLAEAERKGTNLSNYVKIKLFGDNDFTEYYEKIIKNVNGLSDGTRFTVKSLIDPEWNVRKGLMLSLGKAFRKDVIAGNITDIIEIGRDSSNIIWYQKQKRFL